MSGGWEDVPNSGGWENVPGTQLYSPNPDAPTSYSGNYAPPPEPSWGDRLKAMSETANKAVNIAGTQFVKGATALAGLPNTLMDMGDYAMSRLRGVDYHPRPSHVMPTTQDLNKFIFGSLTLPEANMPSIPVAPSPQGKPFDLGKMVDVGLQSIPTFGSAGVSGVLPAFTGGALSEAAGQATEGTPFESAARMVGGTGGFLAGGKLTTPLPSKLTPNEARAVAIAKEKDVPMSVSQETGRLKHVESAISKVPFSEKPFAKLADAQARASQKAALAEGGFVGERTDPETMAAFKQQASDQFEAAKKMPQSVELKPDFYNTAQAEVAKYREATNQSSVIPAVQKRLDDFFDPKLMKGGSYPELSGEQYQTFRKNLQDTIDALPGGGARDALKNIRGALDDAAEASLPAEKMQAWKTARNNWMVYKTLNKAAAYGTSDSRTAGNIAPNALNTALRQWQGADKFATTMGGLNDVGHMNSYLHDTQPYSGTPGKMGYHGLLAAGAGVAGVGGHEAGLPLHYAAAPIGGLVASNLAARALTGQGPISSVVRKYLVNQAMPAAYPQLYRGGIRSAPFALAPGVAITLPQLERDRQ